MAARKNGAMRGRFIPKNPEKYAGNPNTVFFRSSWELHVYKWFDVNPSILRWAVEELFIPYISPLDGRAHKYYPDALVLYKDANGQVKKEILEIKPMKETILTAKSTDRDKQAILVNEAKWKAAAEYAEAHGAAFRVLTERSIFRTGAEKPKKQMGRNI